MEGGLVRLACGRMLAEGEWRDGHGRQWGVSGVWRCGFNDG